MMKKRSVLIIVAMLGLLENAMCAALGGMNPSGSGTDNTRVLKAGDTMTGQLTIAGSSLTVGYGILASTGVFTSTVAVRGNAFSVGLSTFVISAGKFAFGSSALTAGNYVTISPPSQTLGNVPGAALGLTAFTYTYTTAGGVVDDYIGTMRIGQGTYKTTGGGFSSYNNGGSLLIDAPPSGTSGTTFTSSSTILFGNGSNHKIEVAKAALGSDGNSITIAAGDVDVFLEEDRPGGALILESGSGNSLSGTAGFDGDIKINPSPNNNAAVAGRVIISPLGGKVGVGTINPAQLLHISSGTLLIDGTSPTVKIGTMTFGPTSPPQSQALCFVGGALGHCTSLVGATGGCTCVAP